MAPSDHHGSAAGQHHGNHARDPSSANLQPRESADAVRLSPRQHVIAKHLLTVSALCAAETVVAVEHAFFLLDFIAHWLLHLTGPLGQGRNFSPARPETATAAPIKASPAGNEYAAARGPKWNRRKANKRNYSTE
ncbi:hypothetical protein BDY21DRAFT_135362 [Lineolata rhizophorae]|uniref:Uncharacterized protein n=1 Tax=Lineolata rhizophorae TaxID=578093 RepID=A0A6A6PAI3_9PEZI|nr:hypothetical protein BDY21DRAFT_135362 [Lineolata rhizophorae]